MNVASICDALRPLLTDVSAPDRYEAVRPARSLEPDLQDREGVLPLLLIHPWKEDAQPSRYNTVVRQRSDEQFAAVTICRIEDLARHRALLDTVLLGRVLPGYVHEVQAVSGETMAIDATVIWWRDLYITTRERHQA